MPLRCRAGSQKSRLKASQVLLVVAPLERAVPPKRIQTVEPPVVLLRKSAPVGFPATSLKVVQCVVGIVREFTQTSWSQRRIKSNPGVCQLVCPVNTPPANSPMASAMSSVLASLCAPNDCDCCTSETTQRFLGRVRHSAVSFHQLVSLPLAWPPAFGVSARPRHRAGNLCVLDAPLPGEHHHPGSVSTGWPRPRSANSIALWSLMVSAAECSGVQPYLDLAFTSAPAASSSSITAGLRSASGATVIEVAPRPPSAGGVCPPTVLEHVRRPPPQGEVWSLRG